jgi:alpha-1,3-rhamnosyltransferase
VTVIISTYNSSAFIEETLNSVLVQTWKDLELIITDDFSEDNTIEICSGWLSKNKPRFSGVQLLISEKNTGISANANRGLQAANGEWIKFLGADDTLKPTCIEDNMLWISLHPETKALFSRVDVYRDTFTPDNILETTPGDPYSSKSILAPDRNALSQYRMLLVSDRIHFSPSVFLNRDTLILLGGFDEQVRTLEDYPLWLKLTRNGHRLDFMDKTTVNYRQHLAAINNSGIDYLIKPNYFKSEFLRKSYTYPNLPSDIRLEQRFNWLAVQIFRIRILNLNTRFNRALKDLITIYLNPFRYFIWLRRCFNKNLRDCEFYY